MADLIDDAIAEALHGCLPPAPSDLRLRAERYVARRSRARHVRVAAGTDMVTLAITGSAFALSPHGRAGHVQVSHDGGAWAFRREYRRKAHARGGSEAEVGRALHIEEFATEGVDHGREARHDGSYRRKRHTSIRRQRNAWRRRARGRRAVAARAPAVATAVRPGCTDRATGRDAVRRRAARFGNHGCRPRDDLVSRPADQPLATRRVVAPMGGAAVDGESLQSDPGVGAGELYVSKYLSHEAIPEIAPAFVNFVAPTLPAPTEPDGVFTLDLHVDRWTLPYRTVGDSAPYVNGVPGAPGGRWTDVHEGTYQLVVRNPDHLTRTFTVPGLAGRQHIHRSNRNSRSR